MAGYPEFIIIIIIIIIIRRVESRSADRDQRGRAFTSSVAARIRETSRALQVVMMMMVMTMMMTAAKGARGRSSKRRRSEARTDLDGAEGGQPTSCGCLSCWGRWGWWRPPFCLKIMAIWKLSSWVMGFQKSFFSGAWSETGGIKAEGGEAGGRGWIGESCFNFLSCYNFLVISIFKLSNFLSRFNF